MKLHHGCNDPKPLFAAIAAGKAGREGLNTGLHLAPSATVAGNYGKYLVTFILSADVAGAHVGQINKDGNFNASVGNGVEVVLDNSAAIDSFIDVVEGALVRIPDGRVVEMDINSGAVLGVVS